MKLPYALKTIAAATAIGAYVAPAAADNHIDSDLIGKIDGSFVSLRGTVVATDPDSFMLDFGPPMPVHQCQN